MPVRMSELPIQEPRVRSHASFDFLRCHHKQIESVPDAVSGAQKATLAAGAFFRSPQGTLGGAFGFLIGIAHERANGHVKRFVSLI